MIKIVQNENFPRWMQIFAFGNLVEEIESKNKALRIAKPLAKENNMTMAKLAQAFVNTRPFVTSNIIGATSMDQLKENINSINIKLSKEILGEINLVSEKIPNPAIFEIMC